MNNNTTIKLVSIEGRWGQSLYQNRQKSPSVAELLRNEQNNSGALRPYAAALRSASPLRKTP